MRLFSRPNAKDSLGWGDAVLVYSPHDRLEEFRLFLEQHKLASDWELIPQSEGDLGLRMQHFFDTAFESGYDQVLLVGSDTPTLPRSTFQSAIDQLAQNDVVLGPTEDGGYYLVGAKRRTPPIFTGVAWSTEQVWEQTTDQLRNRDLTYGTLPKWYDIDNVHDLRRVNPLVERQRRPRQRRPRQRRPRRPGYRQAGQPAETIVGSRFRKTGMRILSEVLSSYRAR